MKHTLGTLRRYTAAALILVVALTLLSPFGAAPAQAQVPTVTVTAPAAVPLGEQFTFTLTFDNTGSVPGYGPLIDLVLPTAGGDGDGDGISFVSATYLGAPITAIVQTFPGAPGCVNHPFIVDNTNTPIQVCGTPGDQFIALQLPFGSFVPSQPPADIEVTAILSPNANLGFPLPIRARGAFQFGLTPLNDWCCDPPIVLPTGDPGPAWPTGVVNPTVLEVRKEVIAPEDETATGPNFPRRYQLIASIPAGQTITNFVFTDTLPSQIQFVAVTAATVNGVPVTPTDLGTPSTVTPGGTLSRGFGNVTGSAAADDVILEFEFYVPLNDSAGNPVLSAATGDDVLTTNTATGGGIFDPLDPDDPLEPVSQGVIGEMTAKSIAIQKGVTQVGNVGSPNLGPGDTLQYTLNFQVSDFFSFGNIVVNDILGDGQRLVGTPTLTITDRDGTFSGSFTPGTNFILDNSQVPPAYGGTGACGDGRSRLTFNVSQAALDLGAPNGNLMGGLVNAGAFGPTTGQIVFQAVVQDEFACTFPSGDRSVDHGDRLGNDVTITGDVLDNATQTPNGNTEADDSGSTSDIPFGVLTKTVYAVNGSTTFPTPVQIGPGDTVTYRIQYSLPTTDYENLIITDFLPLPVFDADEFTILTNAGVVPPPAGRWSFGPAHTLTDPPITGVPAPAVSITSAANSIVFDFGTFDDPLNRATEIDLMLTVTATDEPFTDSLFLTNQVRVSEGTTNAGSQDLDSIIQIEYLQPVLRTQKSAVASSNPGAVFTPPVGPVTFNAPGTAGARFAGTVLSTASVANSNVSGVDAGDLVTFAIVIENTGNSPNGAFDITIQDVLPPGFVLPSAGPGLNLRITLGDGTGPLAFTDLGGGIFGSGVQLVDPNPNQGICEAESVGGGRNVIVITYDLQVDPNIPPGTVITNTHNVTNYSGTEGGPDYTASEPGGSLTDTATTTVRALAIDKTILATNQAHTADPGVAIGEQVQYQVVVTVPEGQMQNAQLVDTLDQGLAYVSLDSIVVSPTVTTSVPGGFPAVLAGATITASGGGAANQGRVATFDFGTVTNTDPDPATDETITLTYTVVVINGGSNDRTDQRNNDADWSYTNLGSTGTVTVSDAAPNVVIREPLLQVSKVASPISGDAGDTITFTVTLSHTGPSDTDAFDLALTDVIPAGVTYVPGSLQYVSGVVPATLTEASGTISATWATLPDLSNTVFSFQATIDYTVTPGQVITNTATVTWTSLPGDVTTPQSSFNTLSTERTGNPANPGGTVNDYTASGQASITAFVPTPQKYLIETSEAHTSNTTTPPQVAIGEIVRYRVAVQIAEGTSPNFVLTDNLPAGMAYLDDGTARIGFVFNATGITATPPITCSSGTLNITGTLADPVSVPSSAVTCPLPAALLSGGPFADGTDPVFSLGTLQNNDNDNTNDEFVIIEFNALVLNSLANDAGDDLDNTFTITIDGIERGTSAPLTVEIVEPSTTIAKTFTPATGPYDAGDIVTFQLVLTNAAGPTVTNAYDLSIPDTFDAFLTIQNVTAATTGVCNGVNSTASFTVTGQDFLGTVDCLNPGATATFTIETRINANVPAGTEIANLADVTYTSLPGPNGTTTNPTGSPNSGAPGSETGERTGSGVAPNDYLDDDQVSLTVAPPVVDKQTPTPTAYTIGETVTYDILVTLPEGVTQAVRVVDAVADGLDFESVTIVTSGAPLTAPFGGTVPAPTVTGGGGSGDDVTFDFGDITTTDDNVTDNNAFVVRVVLRVLNVTLNQAGEVRANSATLIYVNPETPGDTTVTDATPPGDITLLEPSLTLDKSISAISSAPALPQAGDTVTYQVVITNAAGPNVSTAHDVEFEDAIPAAFLALDLGSISVTPNTGVTDNSSGNTVLLTIASIAPGASVTINYTVTVTVGVGPGDIINNTGRATYSSLPGTTPQSGQPDGERNGTTPPAGLNDYFTEDTASVEIAAGVDFAKDDGGVTQAPIGTEISYTLAITSPLGTLSDLVITDALPEGMIYRVGSAVLSGVSGTAEPALTGPNDGSAATTLTWNLGDAAISASPATITFRAVVANVLSNQAGVTRVNTAVMQYTDVGGNPQQLTRTDDYTIVEPTLTLDKSIAAISSSPDLPEAGDTVTYQVVITNAAGPNVSTAHDVQFEDNIPAAYLLLDLASITVTPSTGVVNTSSGNNVILSIASIAPGASVTINYTVTVTVGAGPGDIINNTGRATYSSLPGLTLESGTPTGERNGTTPPDTLNDYFTEDSESFTVAGGTVDKGLSDTSAAHTPGGTVTIGEIVTYDVRITLPEGTSRNLVVTDLLPDGMQFVAGSVSVITSAATTTNPPLAADFSGTVSAPTVTGGAASGDDVIITFTSDIVVPADGNPDNNSFVVRLQARVLDVPGNQGLTPPPTTLTNSAAIDINSGAVTDTSNPVDVTIVEPRPDVTKTIEPEVVGVGERVTVTLVLRNTGTSEAYDVVLEDALSPRFGDIQEGSTPPGFTLTIVGNTVRYTSNPGVAVPVFDGTNALTFTFTAEVLGPSPFPPGPDLVIDNLATVTQTTTLPGLVPGERDEPDVTGSDSVTLTAPDVSVVKTGTPAVTAPNGLITYTIVVTNNGPVDARGVTVVDTLPTNVALISTATTQGTCTPGVSTFTCNLGDLTRSAPGNTATITVTVRVDPSATGTVINTVTVDTADGDRDTTNNTDDENTPIGGSATADLAITKDNGQTTYTPGSPVTYIIVVTNNGPAAVVGATVTDTVPAVITGVTWTCAVNPVAAGNACGAASGSGNAINTTVDLLPGATATFTVTGTVDAAATGNIVNIATVTAPTSTPDTNLSNNTDDDTDIPTGSPDTDLAITKDDGQTTYTPGSPITYTVTVTNNGPNAVVGAIVTDTVPAVITGVTWTCAVNPVAAGNACGAASGSGNAINTTVDLLPGATATFTISGTIDAAATGDLTNTATVATPPGVTDTNPNNNSDDDTDVPASGTSVDLAITKTDLQTTYTPGAPLTYTIVVTNNGPIPVVGAVVTDNFPPELTNVAWTCAASAGSTCSLGAGTGNISVTVDLLVGGTATFTVNATVDAAATGDLTNTATVTPPAGLTDTNPSNNSSTDIDTPTGTSPNPQVDLAITKDDGLVNYTPGGALTYTIVVTNNGPDAVVGAAVADTFPAALTGVTWTCAVNPVAAGNACGAPAGAGNIATTVDLLPGATATFTVTATVDPAATGNIVNTATVTAPPGVTDTNPSNNSSTDIDVPVGTPVTDLAITKSDGQATYTPGGPLTYTIVVTNNGPTAVVGAAVTDTFPAGLINVTWTCAVNPVAAGNACGAVSGTGNIATTVDLLPGATATFTVTATVDPAATGVILNTATVTAPPGVTDIEPDNNSASDANIPVVDLAVTKTNNQSVYTPGQSMTYIIVVTNNGPDAVVGAAVIDNFPTAFQNPTWTCAVNPVAAGNACASAGGSGNINIAVDLLPGGRATFTVNGTVDPAATGDLTNTVRVEAPPGITETNLSNNTATDTDTTGTGGEPGPAPIVGTADPAITKYGDPSLALPGEIVRWYITVTNHGSAPATNVIITDDMPDPFIVIGAETPQGTYTISGQTVTFLLGTINPGQSVTVVIVTRVRDDVVPPLSVTNEAVLIWDGGTRRTATGTVRIIRQELPATGLRKAEPPSADWRLILAAGALALSLLWLALRRRFARG